MLAQLEYQAGQAEVWRDAVTNWFFRASGIADPEGRVGHYPGRFEAESMKLEGYTVRDVTPPKMPPAAKQSHAPLRNVSPRSNTTAPRDGTRYTLNISTSRTAYRTIVC